MLGSPSGFQPHMPEAREGKMRRSAFLLAAMTLLSFRTAADGVVAPQADQPETPLSAAGSRPSNGVHCLRETGSLIRPGRSGCLDGEHGAVYVRDAVSEQAGTSAADFLRYDPDITVVRVQRH